MRWRDSTKLVVELTQQPRLKQQQPDIRITLRRNIIHNKRKSLFKCIKKHTVLRMLYLLQCTKGNRNNRKHTNCKEGRICKKKKTRQLSSIISVSVNNHEWNKDTRSQKSHSVDRFGGIYFIRIATKISVSNI